MTDEQRARWERMLENSSHVSPEDRVAYLVHELDPCTMCTRHLLFLRLSE